MTQSTFAHFTNQFLASESELGQLICSRDWSDTPLGDIKSWPQSLGSAMSICLNSKFPIAIWWGKDFTSLYNDSFRSVLGSKHPKSLGSKGKDVLPEVWNIIGPMLESALTEGRATWSQNRRLVLNRHGYLEEGYFTFSNSPIYDEVGKIAGVFTTLIENTPLILNDVRLRKLRAEDFAEHVKTQKKIDENEARLRMAIESTGLGTWDFNPITGELTWSEECQKIYAIPPGQNIDFKTFAEHIHPEDKGFVESEIMKAMDPNGPGNYNLTYRILRFTDGQARWIKAQGKVYFNKDKQPDRFIGTVIDITTEKEQNIQLLENELRMRLAVQASEMGTFDWDVTKSEFQYSERLAQIFGYKDTSNLKQEDFSDRIHSEDRQIREAAHEEAFKNGVLFYEARVVWPDGTVRWVRLNGNVGFDQKGVPRRVYGTTLDITDSKTQVDNLEREVTERTASLQKKNEELKRSEERYYKMTEEVQDYAIILLDSDGTILNWNQGASKIKGYREGEVIGENFEIFYLESDRKNGLPQKLINEAKEQGRAMHEGWRKRKDGSVFWGSIVITALHDDKNNVIGYTKVTRDLTERKIAEDKLREHTKELDRKNKELEQFAYIASHDLQEPLRKIQTFTELLEKKIHSEEARKKYFSKINSSARRMAELIKSVLNYSRLSVDDVPFVETDLNVILENVVADYELLIAEKNAIIKNDNLPVVRGVPLQLGQLFANLIGNSLKFSETKPVITVSSKIVSANKIKANHPSLNLAEKYVELIFKDNGIGFEQQYAEKIFTIFQRLNGRGDYAGTGIGLALCKKVVENHHGFIQARSEVGHGAEFYIYLPYDKI